MTNGTGDTSSGHRAGVALLMVGNPEAAIARLESALRNGRTSKILADLAAARIELALADDDPYELVKALDDIEKGAVQGSSMSMAYNRALVLGLLNLRGPALEAWANVRDGEGDPGWRSDAESWLDRLSRPTEAEDWQLGANQLLAWLREGEGDVQAAMAIARRHPQHARILTEEDGFAAWEVAVSGTREGAAAIAARLVMLGAELAAVSGDQTLLRAAEAVASCDALTCDALSDGHRSYTIARGLHENQDYHSAEVLFDKSIDALSRGGTPFAFWPSFYRAVITSHRPDFDRATAELLGLLDHPGSQGSVAQGYLHWMLGFVATRQSEHDTAVRELELARDLFRATGEKENEQAMESLLGSIFDIVGQPKTAWQHHFRAFALFGSSVKSRRIENTLSAAAVGLSSRGEHAAAVVLQETCVAQARRTENNLGVALALRYKAEALAGLGEEAEAVRAVEEGLEWVQRIPDTRLRHDTRVHLLLTWAVVARADPAEALDRVEEAIAFAKHHHLNYLLPQAHATAAAVRRRLDDEDGERAALSFAVAEIDRQRAALTSEDDRIGFAAIARKVMEQGAASLSDRGEWAESFAFADRLRAMSLWDAVGPASPGLRELPLGSLTDGEAVLSYLVLSDRVLGWWVRRETVRGFQIAIERDVLDDLVARFRRAAYENDERALQRMRRRLSDLLLSPVRSELAELDRLIVVPDGRLEELPFSALEADEGGYLIARMAVTTVPAAAFYPLLSRRAEGLSRPSRWLLVTDPLHSARSFPALGPVTAGRRLIERWRRHPGRGVEVLTGDAATPTAFLRAAPAAGVVIFLGHALAPTALSARSGLVLATGDDGREDGLLHPYRVDFAGGTPPRLVILAGCSTGRGLATTADGSVTLGRAFLRTGVPAVVVTLWDVDQAQAAEMTSLLLNALVAGERDPLRAAQLAAITGGTVTASGWMGFQSVGGAG